jgi:protein-L-isoaspartate(D-aspartate) O-methyltransferase
MTDFERQRMAMVKTQIAGRGIRDEHVLRALGAVPRERFVSAAMSEFAYEDTPLPIEEGQTISQPYIVAAMIEAAEVGPEDTVLEVGAGSGYAAAVLGRIAAKVHAIERHPRLALLAQQRLAALGCANVEVRSGDGTTGWPEAAPFDAILVAASGPDVPQVLQAQLAIGGRLVMPIGGGESQRLVKVKRTGATAFVRDVLCAVSFVPLIGKHGWFDDSR